MTAGSARTWLFVPGDRPERFAKAVASGAGLVVIDLEDAVSPDAKDSARRHVREWIMTNETTVAVRINAAGTLWHDDDLTALADAGRPVVIMLPKAEDPAEVAYCLDRLPPGSAVAALIETARGVSRAEQLAGASGVVRLCLGTFDLAAELGVDPAYAPALALARNALVLASAVAGLAPPVDGVTAAVNDDDTLRADIRASAALGFGGKLCVHPRQIAPADEALRPTAAERAWARRVIEADFNGEVVVLVDGRMVDRPVIARARRILGLRPDGDEA
jgi:citrate lyase subunit beta/citryl-CoA lyase